MLISLSIKQYTAVKILLSFQRKQAVHPVPGFSSYFTSKEDEILLTCLKVIGKRHPMAAQHFCAIHSSAPASYPTSQTRLAQIAEGRMCQNNYLSNKSILQKASHFFIL